MSTATARTAFVQHNAGDQDWYTPAPYIDAARATMGTIDLDPASCSTANAVVGAETYYTKDDDGLLQSWAGTVWLNPPYTTGVVGRFARKLVDEFVAGNVAQACVLVNNATETRWFSAMSAVASALCLVRGRVKFYAPGKVSTPLQGQVIIYVGLAVAAFVANFAPFGLCVTPVVTRCETCDTATVGRYCSNGCRQRAYRLRRAS